MPNVVALVTSVSDGLAYLFTTEFDLEPVLDMRMRHPNERFHVGDWLYGELSKDGRKALFMERIVRRLPTSINAQGQVQLQSVVIFAPRGTSENGRNDFQPSSACWSPNVGRVGCPPNFTPPTANVAYKAWIVYISSDVKWMLVEHELQISDIQSDVDEVPWNRKAEISESTLINVITNTYHGLAVMKMNANCMLVFSESCGLVACPYTSTLKIGLSVSFRLKPAAEELFKLTGCQYAADEVEVGVQIYSFTQHHDGMTIRCNNRIFPRKDDRTGKFSIKMDLIGDIEDSDRLITTKMFYQQVSFRATWNYSRPEIWTLTAVDAINQIPYEKFRETNFILPDGTEKLINAIGLVCRIVDANDFMFVWTLGVQPDVIIKMKYCDAVKAGDWIRFSACRTPRHNRFIGEGRAVKVNAPLETFSEHFPPQVKTTVIDEGENVWINGHRIHRVFSSTLGYIIDDRFLISEERYGSFHSPKEYQVLAARIRPKYECQWRVTPSDPITTEPMMWGERKWASVESGLSEGTILTASESTDIRSNGDGSMDKTLIFNGNDHVGSSSSLFPNDDLFREGETADNIAHLRRPHSEIRMPDMDTLVSLIDRMLDDERIVDALKTYRPLEYERFNELLSRI